MRRRGRAGEEVTERGAGAERLDVVAAVLLAFATVATAWSGYQAKAPCFAGVYLLSPPLM